MLTQRDAARYLLQRELLSPRDVLDNGLVVRDASSRNRNFRVETEGGPSFLLKQAIGAETEASLRNEAAAYAHLTRIDEGLARYLPRLYGYDSGEGLLILELVRDAVDLRSHHTVSGHFSVGPAAALGTALGTLHRLTLREADEGSSQYAAWILSVHRPSTSIFREASAATLELLRIVQGAPDFPEALDRTRAAWRAESLVHADIKWDNLLVTVKESGDEELKIVDWEGSTVGDPCWDIGSALAHYLSFWLFSIPVTGELPPARFPELAAYPLDAMKPALATCWRAYTAARGVGGDEPAALLSRSVELAGARLLQTAFEAAQLQLQVTSTLVLHLQLAHNLLERPSEAATRLMGIAPR
jgi:aminoglycoside phosphotransferase (APT) family kinase protein